MLYNGSASSGLVYSSTYGLGTDLFVRGVFFTACKKVKDQEKAPGQVTGVFSIEDHLMSFIERERARLAEALRKGPTPNTYERLYAAQQALAWASDPTAYASPMKQITGIQADSEDCSAHPRPPRS